MSAEYLLKTEPSEYSFEDLQRDGVTVWDGVVLDPLQPAPAAARRVSHGRTP